MNEHVLIDRILHTSMWPEPVRVVRIQKRGTRYGIDVAGTVSHQHFSRLVNEAELQDLIEKHSHSSLDYEADPELFALGVEARRIQLGYTFDPYFAVSASRIDPLPHQLEAVYGVLLKKPKVRYMIADDPGAGKTVMAGLLLKELQYRSMVSRVLIVTPANLTSQWQRELKDKFGETFSIFNRDTVSTTYLENPWESHHKVVTSMDFAKKDSHLELLEKVHWDLVIIDESHRLSARPRLDKDTGKISVDPTERYKLGRLLSQTSHHMLLLTATPHQGDDEKFRLLLDLLEPDLFANTQLLEEASKNNENPIMVRRLKEDMTDFDGKPLFPPRYVHTPSFRLSPSERMLYEQVTDYVTDHFRKAWTHKRRNIGLAMTVLQRRLASSTYAIAQSLENRLKRLRDLKDLVTQEDDPLLNMTDEELADLPEEERWELENQIAERVTLAQNLPELEKEIRQLEGLARTARTLAREENDRKLQELLKVLEKLNGQKLLVFTEHKDTLKFLESILVKKGYLVTTIDGSMTLMDRVQKERDFRDTCQVMIATEAAGEGINLQFCSMMVNYDLPWNPTRLEQRMGRVHRYGQKYDVHIYNLVAEGTREGDVLSLLLTKLEVMRAQLGSDRVYDVVGELLGEINLEQLMIEHLLGRKTLEEIQAMVAQRFDPSRLDHIRKITLEALSTQIDLSRLKEEKQQSEALRLQPEYTMRFFIRAFKHLGGDIQKRQDGLWRLGKIPLELRKKSPSPLPSELLKVTFDKNSAFDAEFLAPGHPLFDLVLQEVLQQATPSLRQGAHFKLDNLNSPAHLGFIEMAVADGQGRTVSRKLFAVQHGEGTHLVEPRIIVDAIPDPQKEGTPGEDPSTLLQDWIETEHLDSYLDEVTVERMREIEIRRKYAMRSLDHLIRESGKRLFQHKAKERSGENMRLAITNEERNQQHLLERKRLLEVELSQAAALYPEPATLIALAHATPAKSPEQTIPNEDDPEVRKKVELAAMRVATEFEKSEGRTPVDVSSQNLGYDIQSEPRWIEVKGRAGVGPIVLTPNEWITARRNPERFFLYIVTNALTQPELTVIQDPASKLSPSEEVTVTRYIVSTTDWKDAAGTEKEET